MCKIKVITFAIISAGVVLVAKANSQNQCTGISLNLDAVDCAAWIAGYNALGGSGWTNLNNPNNAVDPFDPCSTCGHGDNSACCTEGNTKISRIRFKNNNLIGTLPPEWGLLDKLVELGLRSENGISGTIPAEWGQLAANPGFEKIYMCLGDSSLHGALPNTFKNFPSGTCRMRTTPALCRFFGGDTNVCWETVPQGQNENNCEVTEQCVPTPAPTLAPTLAPTASPTPNCAAGRFLDVASNDCVNCPPGQHQDQTGQTSCLGTACPAGKFSTQVAQTSAVTCSGCMPGKYQDQAGQTTCTACPTGKYQDQSTQDSCTACATNTRTIGARSCFAPECRVCTACMNCYAPKYAQDNIITGSSCTNASLPLCDYSIRTGSIQLCTVYNVENSYGIGMSERELSHNNCKYFVNINSATCATHDPPYEVIKFYETSRCNVDLNPLPEHTWKCNGVPLDPGHANCNIAKASESCTECDNCYQNNSNVSGCTTDTNPPCDAILYDQPGQTGAVSCKATSQLDRDTTECRIIRQDIGMAASGNGTLCGTVTLGAIATPAGAQLFFDTHDAPTGCITDTSSGNRFMNWDEHGQHQCTDEFMCRCQHEVAESYKVISTGVCTDHPGFYPIYDATECANVPPSLVPTGTYSALASGCAGGAAVRGCAINASSNTWYTTGSGSQQCETECSASYPCLCQYKGKPTHIPSPHHPIT